MSIGFGWWDVALLLAVSIHAAVVAYLSNPRVKAALLVLPVPFTLATLAVGQPINVTHASGLVALLAFTNAVRVLHQHWRWPIVIAILTSALAYIGLGAIGEATLPKTAAAFWTVCALNMLLGGWLFIARVNHDEPAHRTPLPLWVKLPIILAVVLVVILMKKLLAGFVVTFPMVGVVAAYETRRSLRTTSQAIPLNMVTLTPMLITCRLTQERIGLPASLVLAWVVLLILGTPLFRAYLRSANPAVAAAAVD